LPFLLAAHGPIGLGGPDSGIGWGGDILSFDVASMTLDAMGPIKASSEAITHGAIYLSSSTVVAVFHIHHDTIWKKMIEDGYPSTSPDVEYGSLDMAREVQSLVSSGTTSFVTRGHEDGIFIFGDCLESIEKETLEIYDRFNGA